MKRTTLIALVTALMALPCMGQVRLGVRGGATVSELRFDRDIVSSDNRVGYTAGLVLDMGLPVVGLGLEASVMYTHRDNRLCDRDHVFKRDYIDIPVYARYRLPITGVSHVFAPIAFTGPCFAVLFDDNGDSPSLESSKTRLSWDVGVGADLFNRLRVTASYGIGITKALHYIDVDYNGDKVEGKDRYWTVNAALFF